MNELKIKRKQLGLTQVQAAQLCGVSRRTYQTYEESNLSSVNYNDLLARLSAEGILDGTNYISNVNIIKKECRELFEKQYPEVECAILFGSYARGEARGDSDIDLIIVCPAIGMRFFAIAVDLEEKLHKKIDLHTHEQMCKNPDFLKEILKDGIRVYERKNIIKN